MLNLKDSYTKFAECHCHIHLVFDGANVQNILELLYLLSQDNVLSSEPDSDRRIPVLQTGALTASPYELFAGIEGFEPAPHGLTVHCSTAELYPHSVVCLKGIEPLATGATTRRSSI